MENFSSINITTNINNIAQTKANMVQNSQNTPNQQQAPQPQLQTPQQAQNINPSLMYDFSIAKMDNETVLKYLQNLLKLPNSIEQFVNQLNAQSIDPKIKSILIENMISTKALSELLNQNSTEAISKLLQTTPIGTKFKFSFGPLPIKNGNPVKVPILILSPSSPRFCI